MESDRRTYSEKSFPVDVTHGMDEDDDECEDDDGEEHRQSPLLTRCWKVRSTCETVNEMNINHASTKRELISFSFIRVIYSVFSRFRCSDL